jgi:hypothetical protein
VLAQVKITLPRSRADGADVDFRRVAVTREQAVRYQLPTAPPKATDRRGGLECRTVQAEALDPAK